MRDLYFGGSFDPVHIGHLFIAEEARLQTGAHRVLFVPTGRNPLKPEQAAAPGHLRRLMLESALAGNAHFWLSDIELDGEGPHYTVESVSRLREQGELSPDSGLIVGDDLLAELPRWRSHERLLEMVRLVVLAREGFQRLDIPVPARDTAVVIDDVVVPVSSTVVRNRLREGRSVRYLVPDGVYDIIREYGLYR